MKLSLAVLNTSSMRLWRNMRLVHIPAMSSSIYPVVSVAVYNAAFTIGDNGKESIHQFMKKSTSPDM